MFLQKFWNCTSASQKTQIFRPIGCNEKIHEAAIHNLFWLICN